MADEDNKSVNLDSWLVAIESDKEKIVQLLADAGYKIDFNNKNLRTHWLQETNGKIVGKIDVGLNDYTLFLDSETFNVVRYIKEYEPLRDDFDKEQLTEEMNFLLKNEQEDQIVLNLTNQPAPTTSENLSDFIKQQKLYESY